MAVYRSRLGYRFNLFWLIFWMIIFFPIGCVLLLTGFKAEIKNSLYYLHYHGSRFWLGFWLAAFFPIAIGLFFYNGISFIIDKPELPTIEV